MPELSVIIPTYNRVARLQRVLTALTEQYDPATNFEVIVISDGSTDGTLAYLSEAAFPFSLRALHQENQGAAAARNLGIQAATGDLILFLDDDVLPAGNLITEHIRSHREAADDVVVLGPMLTPKNFTMRPWVRWEQAMLYKQYDEMAAARWQPTARQFYTGNASVARKQLLAVGGFDSTFRRAEDVELAYRLADQGLNFLFCATAIGYHYADRSFASWLKTPYQYGKNDVIFAQQRGQDWLLETVAREFYTRNQLIQLLVLAVLSRSFLGKRVIQALHHFAALATTLGRDRVTSLSYSGIFNLQYYQGMADTLGGRQLFLTLLSRQQRKTPNIHRQLRGLLFTPIFRHKLFRRKLFGRRLFNRMEMKEAKYVE